MMTLLKEVEFCSPILWQEIPEHFRQVFLDCIHLSPVENLFITHLPDFPLSALHSVKRLTLCGWWENEYDTTKLDDSVAHKFQLESLSLRDFCHGSLQKVIAWFPTCTLRYLDISGGRDLYGSSFPYEGLAPLLDNCSNSLTDLELSLG